ncbi:MAG: DNA-directed RNA polymerase sigma-70 factor [Herpetosiphonaceae bacterium]|nr:MAG: DNA-directed RNA polymerase sigma-70 factor [Herpetosiphonaceae bacterium]
MPQLEEFNRHRPLLFSIAYRMLGSVMDAEDIVQEAFLRWQSAAEDEIQSPKAYLSTIVTRLCIDQLRSAKAQREQYIGIWLPEPLVDRQPDAGEQVVLSESLSLAFLVLLEQLTPLERAVFLLREVFDYDYAEIARIVGRSEAACRQLLHRARQRITDGRPRFTATQEQQRRVTALFFQACASGDMQGLLTLLAEDITVWSDSGGLVPAARRPVRGCHNVARFLLGLARHAPADLAIVPAQINGQAGFITYIGGRPQSVVALEIAGERIQAIRIVVNPEKLRAVPALGG